MPNPTHFYPAQLDELRRLTDENDHELAMWYAAHQLGLEPLEHELATHVCLCQLAGELTPVLQHCSHHLRARLMAALSEEALAAFLSVT